jgi:hypothetical protein
VIHATESLEQKTARDEIPSTPIEGILLFYAELPKASVIDAHTRWELSVTDIYGAQTTVVKVVGDMLSR